MAVIGPWEKKRIFITVRTYPTPARQGVEVFCTAGITDDGQWIRLFPVPYRFLENDQRFKKYQWIEVEVAKDSDSRLESHQIHADSIKILENIPPNPNDGWKARRSIIGPLQAHCLCCLKQARDQNGYPTLGFYKPANIRRLVIDPTEPRWSEADLAKLGQPSMFEKTPFQLLEKVPYRFVYHVDCDEPTCNGHRLSCTDWEMGEAYRRWRHRYGNQWEEKFRQRFEYEMINRNDTHLFVGTVRAHPASWIIVGLFYPKNLS